MSQKFTPMNDASPLVKLAMRLDYKVYKEVLDFDNTRHASYRVKNNRGEVFGGDTLTIVLANAIKHDFKPHARGEGAGKRKESG